jgi:hypothetical protein
MPHFYIKEALIVPTHCSRWQIVKHGDLWLLINDGHKWLKIILSNTVINTGDPLQNYSNYDKDAFNKKLLITCYHSNFYEKREVKHLIEKNQLMYRKYSYFSETDIKMQTTNHNPKICYLYPPGYFSSLTSINQWLDNTDIII